MGIFNDIISVVYPNRCPFCGEIIDSKETICEDCETKLPRVKNPKCNYCGCNKTDCNCKKRKRKYKAVISPFYYEGIAKDAIHKMKFNDKPHVSKVLANEISKVINEDYSDTKFDIVTSVPMTNHEKNNRGYNQSELLVKYLKLDCEAKKENRLLIKLEEVPPQHSLSGAQRQGNVIGIFDVNKKIDIQDKIILLCDDVKTTGSTANECASVLLDYGAKEVYLCCCAITRKK